MDNKYHLEFYASDAYGIKTFDGFFFYKESEPDESGMWDEEDMFSVKSTELGVDEFQTYDEVYSKIDEYLTNKLGFEPEYEVEEFIEKID